MTETTFKQAYCILQSHSETLRNQREPNIDDLLTIVTESVTESVAAYKTCKSRIEAVEQALEQALSSTGVEVAPSFNSTDEANQRLQAISEERGAGDDDVPF